MTVETTLADALLGSAADAIIASDREGKITFWTPGAARIFGFSAAEANGCSLDLIIPDRLRARHWQGYAEVMRTGESRYGHGDLLSVPALRKGERGFPFECTIVPLKDEVGAMAGMVAVMRDVTARFEEMRGLKQKLAQG